MWHSQGLETSVWPCFRGVFTPERPAAQVTIDQPTAFWPYFSSVFRPRATPAPDPPAHFTARFSASAAKPASVFSRFIPREARARPPGAPAGAHIRRPRNDPRYVARTTPPPEKRRHKALQTQGSLRLSFATGVTHDVSAGGVRVEVRRDRPYAVGDRVDIAVQWAHGTVLTGSTMAQGVVRRIDHNEPGRQIIAIETSPRPAVAAA